MNRVLDRKQPGAKIEVAQQPSESLEGEPLLLGSLDLILRVFVMVVCKQSLQRLHVSFQVVLGLLGLEEVLDCHVPLICLTLELGSLLPHQLQLLLYLNPLLFGFLLFPLSFVFLLLHLRLA